MSIASFRVTGTGAKTASRVEGAALIPEWPTVRRDWLTQQEISSYLKPALGLQQIRDELLIKEFGTLLIRYGRGNLFPAFQVDRGQVRTSVRELACILAEPLATPAGTKKVIDWLFTEQSELRGARPARRFASDPQAVIEAATRYFATSPKPTKRSASKRHSGESTSGKVKVVTAKKRTRR